MSLAHELAGNAVVGSTVLDIGKIAVPGLLVATIPSIAKASLRTVPDGSVGVRHRHGRTRYKRGRKKGELLPYLEPGTHRLMPGSGKIELVSLQLREDPLKGLHMDSEDGSQLAIISSVEWRVLPDGDNPWKSITAVEKGVSDSVLSFCGGVLTDVLSGKKEAEIKDRRIVNDALLAAANDPKTGLLKYGVELNGLLFYNAHRVEGTLTRDAGLAMVKQYFDSLHEPRGEQVNTKPSEAEMQVAGDRILGGLQVLGRPPESEGQSALMPPDAA